MDMYDEKLIEEAAAKLLRIVLANEGQPVVHTELRTRALAGLDTERSKSVVDLALLSLVDHRLLARMGYGPFSLYIIPPESMYQATQMAYADFPCESDVSGGMAALADADVPMAPAPRLPTATSPCGFATAALRRQMSPRPRPPRGAGHLRTSTRFCGKRGNGGGEEASQKRARVARPQSAQSSGGDPMSP